VPTSARCLTWAGYAATTLLGLYVAALGPGLPEIAARTHTSAAQAGTLFTALFAGGLATSLAAGRTMDRFGRRPLLMAGGLLNGLGSLALLLAGSWPQVIVAGFLLGCGDGMLVVGYHALFADLHWQKAARQVAAARGDRAGDSEATADTAKNDAGGSGAALNRLNVFFGIGALVGPALAGASILAVGDIRLPLWLVAGGQCAIVLVLTGVKPPSPPARGQTGSAHGLRDLLRLPLLWVLGLLLFLYVALEVGLGNWAYTYLRRGGAGVAAASLLTTGYWLGLTFGRLVSPWLLQRLREPVLLLGATVATMLVAMVLFILAPWRPGGAACILALGVCFGPIWPLTFAIATGSYREAAGAVSGLLTTAGTVSGLAGPWLLGVLLLQHGARWGMSYTLVGAAGMLALAFLARRQTLPSR